MSESVNSRPVLTLRRRGVKVSVFLNKLGTNTIPKVSAQKVYCDDSGLWKTTSAFGRDDLPILQLLVGKAWEYILEKESEPNQLEMNQEVKP